MRLFFLPLIGLPLAGCVSWQPLASTTALACDAGDIRISHARSGALLDRWQASCRGLTYQCSAPAGQNDQPAACELQPPLTAIRIVPLSE